MVLRQSQELVSYIVQLSFRLLKCCRKDLFPPPPDNICTHFTYAAIFRGDVLAYNARLRRAIDVVDEFYAACFPHSVFLVALLPKRAPSPIATRPNGLVEEAHSFRGMGRARQFWRVGRIVYEI